MLSLVLALQIMACSHEPVPGKDHVLNPHAPVSKQVQERHTVCEQVTLPDPPCWENKMCPITDFKHDPRAFT